MNSTDRKIYESVCREKKMTEIFLGSVCVEWHYSIAQYSADCTEALPLNLFEKAICGLLSIKGEMSIMDVADVLGLNIKEDPQHLIFKDRGEDEILLENLKSLEEYGMITSDDDYYSHIQLTEIGKEYYSKRNKFRTGLNKQFSIYYDLETEEHSKAKQIFGVAKPEDCKDYSDIPAELSDEGFIKSFAHEQIPSIYDESRGDSFTNLQGVSYTEMYVNVMVGVLFDVLNKKCKLIVSPNPPINREYLQTAINGNVKLNKEIITQFLRQSVSIDTNNPGQEEFEETLIKVQSDFEYGMYLEKPEEAIGKVDDYKAHAIMYEEGELFAIIKDQIQKGTRKEVVLNFPLLCEVHQLIKKLSSTEGTIIYVITTDDPNKYKFPPNVLVANAEQVAEQVILSDSCIVPSHLTFNIEGTLISIKCYERNYGETRDIVRENKRLIACHNLPLCINEYEEVINDWNDFSFEAIPLIKNSRDNVSLFDEFVDELGYAEKLLELDNARDELISRIKSLNLVHLSDEFIELSDIQIGEIPSLEEIASRLDDIKELESKLADIESKAKGTKSDAGYMKLLSTLKMQLESFKKEILEQEKHLRQEMLQKVYVIDTNVLISCPTIFDYFDKKDRIVVSFKVLDELDSLKIKLKGEHKKKLRVAIKTIHDRLRKKALITQKANQKILPEEFQKNSGDYMILSVAYEYKLNNENVFLLTEDINLQSIAMSLAISVKSIEDIVPQDVKLINLLSTVFSSFRFQTEPVTLVKFAQKIGVYDATFSPPNHGIRKLKDLCLAYPDSIELFENDNKELCIKIKDKNQENKK